MHAASQIRNLAIIAHIDHGKTTLIDSIFRAAHVFRENAHVDERVMDSNDLERERGITIRSKHCTVEWKDYLINIIDTPGHADFSGEVERVLSMVDSVLLLVDANEGPMPQTRYVLMRALSFGLRPIVIVNKADRPNADPSGALDKTFDLFVELGANNEQLDFPVLYGSGLEGWIVNDIDEYKKEEHEREEHLHDGGGLSPALLRGARRRRHERPLRDHHRRVSPRPRSTRTRRSSCRSARWPGATTSAASAAAACSPAGSRWATSCSASPRGTSRSATPRRAGR